MMIFNILLAIASVILFAGASSQMQNSTFASEQKRALLEESIQSVNQNILELTYDLTNWKKILARNGSLICVTRYLENNPPVTTPPCVNNMTGVLSLDWPDGSAFINGSGQLFGLDGRRCLTAAGNCPWRIQLDWRIDCNTPCTDPIVYVRSQVSLAGSLFERLVFNSKKYEFDRQVGPNSQNKWVLCASRNAVYLPQGFNGVAPDRQGCVDTNAFNGRQGVPGSQGPSGTVTLLPKRDSITHCSGIKIFPNFSGGFSDAISWERLNAGLKLHWFPASSHCTGIAMDVEIVGSKGTRIRIPCRPANSTAQCFVYNGQTYLDVKHAASPVFDVTAGDLQSFINNQEDIAEIRYDWSYNSGGAGATCFVSIFNKMSYGFAMVVESNYDKKPSYPSSCTPVGVYVADPSFFN